MVRPGARLTILLLSAASATPAQKVISAKAGLVYHVQGRVSVEGSGVLTAGGRLRQLSDGETLFTERGRAEVLLNPGTVLRLSEMSRMRMDDVTLTDARLCIESGSAVVTVGVIPKADRIEINVGGTVVELRQAGVYRFDVRQARVRVYSGRAEARLLSAVAKGNTTAKVAVKRGQSVGVEDLELARFDPNDTDAFQRWANARSRTPEPRGLRAVPPRLSWRAGVSTVDAQSSDVNPYSAEISATTRPNPNGVTQPTH